MSKRELSSGSGIFCICGHFCDNDAVYRLHYGQKHKKANNLASASTAAAAAAAAATGAVAAAPDVVGDDDHDADAYDMIEDDALVDDGGSVMSEDGVEGDDYGSALGDEEEPGSDDDVPLAGVPVGVVVAAPHNDPPPAAVREALDYRAQTASVLASIRRQLKSRNAKGAASLLKYMHLAQNGTAFDKVREVDKDFGHPYTWTADWVRAKLLSWAPLLGVPLPRVTRVGIQDTVRFDLRETVKTLLEELPRGGLLQAKGLRGSIEQAAGTTASPMYSAKTEKLAKEWTLRVKASPEWKEVAAYCARNGLPEPLFIPLFLIIGDDSAPVGTGMTRSMTFFATKLQNCAASVVRTHRSSMFTGE